MLHIHPIGSGSVNGRGGNFRRPCKQLMAIGMPYEMLKAITDIEEIALKTLLDTKNTQPRTMTTTAVRHNAFNGTPPLDLCTRAKNALAGSPPSLANAQINRLLVVIVPMLPNSLDNVR